MEPALVLAKVRALGQATGVLWARASASVSALPSAMASVLLSSVLWSEPAKEPSLVLAKVRALGQADAGQGAPREGEQGLRRKGSRRGVE